MTNDNTVEVKFSLPPEMAILFFRLLTLKDDGDFWKELADACVAHSTLFTQRMQFSQDREREARVIVQLKGLVRIISAMEGLSS
ncbi:MAG: hypothetical protein GY832_13810 [Chloroflexi bacterium]|nr:hypothetical protein [Chloroflexota bacterium]